MEKGSYMPIIEFNRAAVRAPDLDEASKRLLLRVKTTLDGRTYAGAIRALDYFLRFVQSDSQHYQKWANLAFIPFATAPLVSYASHASTPLAQELIEQTRNAGFNPWECIFVEGCIKAARDHEWTQALKLFEAAEKGSQRESIYYWWHTALLASMGKIHDSIEILDAAVRHFSRRNIATRTDLAMLQIMDERYEDAEETLSSTLDFVSPGNPLVACSFAVLYEAQNRLNDAYVASNDWTDRIRAIPDPKNISYNDIIRVDWHSYLSGMLALVLGRSGATDYARDWLDTILERKAKNRVQPSVEIGIGLIGVNSTTRFRG
jgi:tetratricopeptide (TPR) repeat protein